MIIPFCQFIRLHEAVYKGNIGIMELVQFMSKAKKEDPDIYRKVKSLIDKNDSKAVWKIIQDYLDVQLVGKEFN